MRILHLEYDRYPKEAQQALAKFDVVSAICNNQEELYAVLRQDQYEAIFTRLGLYFDSKAIALQPNLQYLVTSTTGLNHIDTETAEKKGIQLVSLKGESSFLAEVKSTAEHTWGLVLSLIRKLPKAIESVQQGEWNRVPFLSDELDGKKLGIIGYGRLGKIVANYGIAFGMEVMAYDHHPENYANHTHISRVTLEHLLTKADVVVLLISYSSDNENFMDGAKFSKMKSSAYFINTARGELVDEDVLLEMLKTKKLKGAALDVLRNDSAWSTHTEGSQKLLSFAKQNSNLLITPHMGGYGRDSIAKTRLFVTNKFLKRLS